MISSIFFFQAEDGIRDLVRSRGLGDVYKRQFQQVLEITDTLSPVIQPIANFKVSTNGHHLCEGDLSLIHI